MKTISRIPVLIFSAALLSLLAMCNDEGEIPGAFQGTYDVGGYALYMSGVGENGPVVVLESGIGDGGTMSGWETVMNGVKDFARICLYDRAGLGKSEKAPGVRSTEQIADELHALLEAAPVNGPYILVGHSLGGLHIQTYADRYPDEAVGMVFVDPTPKAVVDTLSDEQLDNLKKAGASEAVLAEAGPGLNASIPFFRTLPRLADVPVVVITSSFTGEGEVDRERYEQLRNAHETLSEEVADGCHVVATKSGHYIQMDEPELVIEAIRNVYNKVAESVRRTPGSM